MEITRYIIWFYSHTKIFRWLLNLSGQEREIQFSNTVSSKTRIKSKLVNFSTSSGSHPGKINFKNAWILENLNLPSNKICNTKIKDNGHTNIFKYWRKFRLLQYERHFDFSWRRHANCVYRSRNQKRSTLRTGCYQNYPAGCSWEGNRKFITTVQFQTNWTYKT